MISASRALNEEETTMATYYRIRVRGQLDLHWSAWFGGLAITHDADGNTVLEGLVTDYAALYGLLSKARDLGLLLLAVNGLEETPAKLKPGT
jgi:hypothetical protein